MSADFDGGPEYRWVNMMGKVAESKRTGTNRQKRRQRRAEQKRLVNSRN